MINPLETHENSGNILEIEKYITKFYNKTKNSSIHELNQLCAFNDIDLEAHVNENGEIDVDLEELLKI